MRVDAPVGGIEAEAVPALSPPSLREAPPREDEVLAAGLRQVVAHGQAGLPSPDDEGLDAFAHPGLPPSVACRPAS